MTSHQPTHREGRLAPATALACWHRATRQDFPLVGAQWAAITTGDPGFVPDDLIVAGPADKPHGFALVKPWRPHLAGCERSAETGWIALLAVDPDHQRRGVGRELLARAEARLRDHGAKRVLLGGSFHHALPGIPSGFAAARAIAAQAGYLPTGEVWDVRRDLQDGTGLPPVSLPADVAIRPVAPGEVPALRTWLGRAFPGRWARDVGYHLDTGGSPADIVGLFVGDRLAGFAWIHPPSSRGALRWAGFEPQVAALGPIGVDETVRGRGLGLGLLVGGLAALQAAGAGPTVIDWTTLLDFYARVGFTPFLPYTNYEKVMP